MVARLSDSGSLPSENQLIYGIQMVKENIGTASIVVGVDHVIKAVVR